MLYDIKGNGVVYHDYKIVPLLNSCYSKFPESMKSRKIKDYVELFEGAEPIPEISRQVESIILLYNLEKPISGTVGSSVLVYKDASSETVLKLKMAKCILSEEGGVLSHAAIIAKEVGVPFVAGLPGISSMLKKGDRIKISLAKMATAAA